MLLNSSKPSSYTSGNKCIITCTSGLSIVMYLTTLLPGPREVLGLMFSLCTPPYCIFMAAILLSVSLVCMLELGNNNKIMCSLMLRNMRYIVEPCYCHLLVIAMTTVDKCLAALLIDLISPAGRPSMAVRETKYDIICP